MNRKRLAVGLAMGLIVAVAIGRAAAREIRYEGTLSGSFVSTQIDAINPGDGLKAVLGIFAGKTNKGQITAQAVVEDIPAPSPSGTCPAGTDAEFALGSVHGVHRFHSGDLLLLTANHRTACVDFDTLSVSFSERGTFIGGTGKFAGATGSWEVNGTGGIVVADPAGQLFGHFTGELSGTINTSADKQEGR